MRAIESAGYSFLGAIFNLVVSVIGMGVLGRLLSPEAFGEFALCYSLYLIFAPLLDFGLTAAYIKRSEVNEEVNSSFFMFNLSCGIMIAILISICAPFLSTFYDNQNLTALCVIIALTAVVMSAGNQPMSQLMRSKRFDIWALISSGSTLLGLLVGISLAWMGWGVWALVTKLLSMAVFRLCSVFLFLKPTYRLVGLTTIKRYIDSLRFGAYIAGSRLVQGYANNLDRFIVGKIFGESLLGQYDKGIQIAEKPNVVRNAMTAPAMAHIARLPQNNTARPYVLIVLISSIIAGFPVLFLFLYGDVLTILILGSQWTEAASFALFLAFYGYALILKGLTNVIHINEEKARRLLKVYIVSIVIIYPIAVITYFVQGQSLYHFVAIFSMTSILFWIIVLANTLKISSVEQTMILKSLGFVVWSVVAFCSIGYFLKSLIQWPEVIEMWIVGLSTSLLTLMTLVLLFPRLSDIMRSFVVSQINSWRSKP